MSDSYIDQPRAVEILRCPTCSELAAVPILHGMPTYESYLASERGEMVLAGCLVGEDDDDWWCHRCATGFGAPSELAAARPITAFARWFADRFAAWDIELPEVANALRLSGVIFDLDWQVRWVFGRAQDGREHLDLYAMSHMADDSHERVWQDGSIDALPALGWPEGDLRAHLITRDDDL